MGRHCFLIEGDVVRVWLKGALSAEHARYMLAVVDQEIRRLPFYFLLLDIREAHEPPELGARNVLVEWTKKNPPRAAAVVGGSFLLRTFVTLAAKATVTLARRPGPPRFFAHEDEALSWFAQQRGHVLENRHP